jgi:hypothetical protein
MYQINHSQKKREVADDPENTLMEYIQTAA